MRMNRLNGWMRLWLLLSTLWLAIIASITIVGLPEKPVHIVIKSIPDAPSDNSIRAGTIEWDDEKPWEKYSNNHWGHEEAPTYEQLLDEYHLKLKDEVVSFLVLAFTPIFFALFLGHGIAWVRRGFKQNNSSTLP